MKTKEFNEIRNLTGKAAGIHNLAANYQYYIRQLAAAEAAYQDELYVFLATEFDDSTHEEENFNDYLNDLENDVKDELNRAKKELKLLQAAVNAAVDYFDGKEAQQC